MTFLSYAQRFLYGEGKRTGSDFQEDSAIRGFHRDDITKVRMIFPGSNTAPATFTVAHVDLYFFYDIDVAILVVEIYADDVLLWQVQNSPFALADAIPPIGSQTGMMAIVPSMWNICPRKTRCSPCPTMTTARSISRLSASTGRSVSPLTENFCSNRWCCTIQTKPLQFGTDRSNTI